MNDLMISISRGILSFVLGWAAMVCINLSTNMMLALVSPDFFGPTDMGSTNIALGADLVLVGLTYTIGAAVVVLTARQVPWAHGLIFGVSVLVIVLFSCFSILGSQPLWYRGMMLAFLPFQIVFGVIMGLRIRSQRL